MRKTLLLFIVLAGMQSRTTAQYHPMLGDSSTKWCLVWNVYLLRADAGPRIFDYNRFEVSGDTTIASVAYHNVYTDMGYFGAVREDSAAQKVYFLYPGDTDEQLLYDFSLDEGDTIVLDLHNNTNDMLKDGNYIVDSVGLVNIRGGWRKYMELQNPLNPGSLNLVWIESVGEIHNPFYPYMYDDVHFGPGMACGHQHESIVFNNEQDTLRNYVDMCTIYNIEFMAEVAPDTCELTYLGSVAELEGNLFGLNVYPNPCNGQNFTLSIPSTKAYTNEMQLFVTDLNGKTVHKTAVSLQGNTATIQNINLQKGMYMLALRQGGTLVARGKLLVE